MLRMMLIAATVLSASVGAAVAQDRALIQKLNDEFASAFNKGDAGAVAARYTEDAVALPPGAPMITGRRDIEAFWRSAAGQIGDLKLTTVDVKPLGADAAREIGRFTLKTKGQSPQEVAGKYVVVWQKVGADWQLATDIWNTDR